jgi:hypothetical protein
MMANQIGKLPSKLTNTDETGKSLECIMIRKVLANQRILQLLAKFSDMRTLHAGAEGGKEEKKSFETELVSERDHVRKIRADLNELKLRHRVNAQEQKRVMAHHRSTTSQAESTSNEPSGMEEAVQALEAEKAALEKELKSFSIEHSSWAEKREAGLKKAAETCFLPRVKKDKLYQRH